MRRLAVLILIVVSFQTTSFSQEQLLPLSEDFFYENVYEKGWSVEDTTMKKDYEMMFLALSTKTLTMMYANWIESISINSCTFSISIKTNFFEIKLKRCDSTPEVKYLYGYFQRPNEMHILMTDKKVSFSNSVLKHEDWLIYQKLVE